MIYFGSMIGCPCGQRIDEIADFLSLESGNEVEVTSKIILDFKTNHVY